MRIQQLASYFIEEACPSTSFTFDLAIGLCQSFLKAKYFSLFALIGTDSSLSSIYSKVEEISGRLNFKLQKEDLEEMLYTLDGDKGVFLTAYWLTYIFDMQERVEYVWSRFPVFFSITSLLLDK